MENINLKAYTRFKNKQMLEGNKANFHVCLPFQTREGIYKSKCSVCKRVIYYGSTKEECGDLLEKNAKKICIECALKPRIFNTIESEETKNILRSYASLK